jgi:hypothetical protein
MASEVTYEERAVAALGGPSPSVNMALRGIGWALLALAEAVRPQPPEKVWELSHGSED